MGLLLALGGREVAQCSVEALGAVEAGDGVEDLLASVGVGREARPVRELELEGGPDGFPGGPAFAGWLHLALRIMEATRAAG